MQSPFIHNERPIELDRFPFAQVNRSLQAWDASDEYIINYINEHELLKTDPSIAVFNDSFGAIAVNLYEYNVQLISDSYISEQGIKENFQNNFIPQENLTYLDSVSEINGAVDLIILKLPKSNAYLEYQLQQIQKIAHKDSVVIAAARAKDIHTSTLKLFEKHLGETKTSLAVKKARLIFANVDAQKKRDLSMEKVWQLDGKKYGIADLTIANKANVFSRDSLDIGGRYLLEQLPDVAKNRRVADLGCGNGVIGLTMLAKNPSLEIHFYDESYMAIASTKQNVETNLPEQLQQCHFHVNDCLTDVAENSLDLILCNPPFHQQQAVTDHIAWQMFKQSYKTLKTGGELRIIGNQQLAYHIKLQRLFGNCKTIASNKKFVVLSAKK
ncbi:methyltransferase [Thalassomonas sp. M1454]|uniref:methyltransferase n=1 Tax=Thalassomonas sp. M1454 TaxID=2594477 RepID=UPI0011810BBB|nr:methyltransferase [Thalassomonas sp. M1454]TRX55788.1 methyltransferase [Thalassomonas sp. M1454]